MKPADLAGQTLLLTEHGCGYRAKLDRLLAMQNIRPGHVTEFSSVEAIKQCVAAGMGIALLPAIAVAREIRQHHFKALHWAGSSLDIQTHILWHKDKWVSPAMAAFRDLVKDTMDEGETRGQRAGDLGNLRAVSLGASLCSGERTSQIDFRESPRIA